jgi:hypothetical protein
LVAALPIARVPGLLNLSKLGPLSRHPGSSGIQPKRSVPEQIEPGHFRSVAGLDGSSPSPDLRRRRHASERAPHTSGARGGAATVVEVASGRHQMQLLITSWADIQGRPAGFAAYRSILPPYPGSVPVPPTAPVLLTHTCAHLARGEFPDSDCLRIVYASCYPAPITSRCSRPGPVLSPIRWMVII